MQKQRLTALIKTENVYNEEYPGMPIQKTLFVGDKKVTLEEFQEITGSAYFRLLFSLMNENDSLKLGRGGI